ncbi:hypothetical protein BD779DRAFT_1672759 [Infundibulicybe gibba]|nr:hypothetical protein BD779DRAFT_1672759 [Infundibulicybe gibba]
MLVPILSLNDNVLSLEIDGLASRQEFCVTLDNPGPLKIILNPGNSQSIPSKRSGPFMDADHTRVDHLLQTHESSVSPTCTNNSTGSETETDSQYSMILGLWSRMDAPPYNNENSATGTNFRTDVQTPDQGDGHDPTALQLYSTLSAPTCNDCGDSITETDSQPHQGKPHP